MNYGIDDIFCWDNDGGYSLIVCQKPKGHTGDRHGYSNIGGMSAAWGYVDEAETK